MTIRKAILFALILPLAFIFVYTTFIIGSGTIKYLSLNEAIAERFEDLKKLTQPKNSAEEGIKDRLLKKSHYFETPIQLLDLKTKPTKIFDRNDKLIGEFSSEHQRVILDLRDIPPFFIKALIATEDRSFYQHNGYNIRSIARAAVANISSGKTVQGGSTLTQQLSKILFTTRKRQLSRKIFELICAIKMEKYFSKNEIILLYANLVYFGHGSTGLAQIAHTYYQKSPRYLTSMECAHLVSILANPTLYSPFLNPEYSKKRHFVILKNMVDAKLISKSYMTREYDQYWKRFENKTMALTKSFWDMRINHSPYFNESIRRKLLVQFSSEELLEGGLNIYTSLDLDLDRIGRKALEKQIKIMRLQLSNENIMTNKAGKKKPRPIEGALIAIDNRTGEVITAVGGSGFSIGNQLLRFEQMRRPIGSLGKPFIYLQAMNHLAYSNQTQVEDLPLKIKIPRGYWKPQNYDHLYTTNVSLENALIQSINIPAINTLKALGPTPFIQYLRIAANVEKSRIPHNLSIALGSFDLSPLEIGSIYSSLARKGSPVEPIFIRYVKKGSEEIIFDQAQMIQKNQNSDDFIVSPEYVDKIIAILKKVLTEKEGTAHYQYKKYNLGPIEVAGKTGTTQDRKDTWFAGFTPQVTCVVWLGYDKNLKIKKGSGGRVAAPVFMEYIKKIYNLLPVQTF